MGSLLCQWLRLTDDVGAGAGAAADGGGNRGGAATSSGRDGQSTTSRAPVLDETYFLRVRYSVLLVPVGAMSHVVD